MSKLIPKNIEGTIANDKIIKKLDDNTFAEVTASDITALGFSAGGGGDVAQVQGIIYTSATGTGGGSTSGSQNKLRVGFRGETITDAGFGNNFWYVNTDKTVIVDEGTSIVKRNIGNLQSIASLSTPGGNNGRLMGHKDKDFVFAPTSLIKINTTTMASMGTYAGGGTLGDISPDGSLGITVTYTDTSGGIPGFYLNIKVFNTDTLITVQTKNINISFPNAFGQNSLRHFNGVQFISNTEYVLFYRYLENNGSQSFDGLDKYNVATNNQVGTFGVANMAKGDSMVYNQQNDKIYITRSGGGNPGLIVNSSFSGGTTTFTGGLVRLYKDWDTNISGVLPNVSSGSLTTQTVLVYRSTNNLYTRSNTTGVTVNGSLGNVDGIMHLVY